MSDLAYWAADNLELWRPYALVILEALTLLSLRLAFEVYFSDI